jgi:hypothetical protein
MDTVLIFSRDRPMQLLCTLETLVEQARDLAGTTIQVLLRASDDVFLRQYHEVYRRISTRAANVLFIEERSFADDLVDCMRLPTPASGFQAAWNWPGRLPTDVVTRTTDRFERALLCVDDGIFVSPFCLTQIRAALETHDDLLGVSLRLGENCTVNYMAGRPQKVPKLVEIQGSLLGFRWSTADGDFGYPLEVSSSVYRVADILPALETNAARKPNLLEYCLTQLAPSLETRRPRLACYRQSVAFCNPVNLVQQVCVNRAGGDAAHDVAALSRRFAAGERIRHEDLRGFVPTGCHQEVPLAWTSREDAEVLPAGAERGCVSVVIPTYNRRHLVLEAIESVLTQNYDHLEVIVVDDGSTDGTGEAVQERFASDPRVRYVWQENAERCAARNAGIALARGEVVRKLVTTRHRSWQQLFG